MPRGVESEDAITRRMRRIVEYHNTIHIYIYILYIDFTYTMNIVHITCSYYTCVFVYIISIYNIVTYTIITVLHDTCIIHFEIVSFQNVCQRSRCCQWAGCHLLNLFEVVFRQEFKMSDVCLNAHEKPQLFPDSSSRTGKRRDLVKPQMAVSCQTPKNPSQLGIKDILAGKIIQNSNRKK